MARRRGLRRHPLREYPWRAAVPGADSRRRVRGADGGAECRVRRLPAARGPVGARLRAAIAAGGGPGAAGCLRDRRSDAERRPVPGKHRACRGAGAGRVADRSARDRAAVGRPAVAAPGAGPRHRAGSSPGRVLARLGPSPGPEPRRLLPAREGDGVRGFEQERPAGGQVAARRGARTRRTRNHRRGAPAARWRAAVAGAARLPAARRRDHRPGPLLRARPRQGPGGSPEGQLADLRCRLSPGVAAYHGQAGVRPACRPGAAVVRIAGDARGGRGHPAREPGPRHLPPGARRPGWRALHRVQVPEHARRCRKGGGSALGRGAGSARHARGTADPQGAHRRAAAALQRPPRRDELRRPAAGTAGIRGASDRAGAVLRGASHGEARTHGVGTGTVLLRRERRAVGAQARVRPVLREEPHARAGHHDHARDRARGPAWRGCARRVRTEGAH